MIKRRKITSMYITEAICDKCGSKLLPTNVCLTTYPPQYPYACENKNCDGYQVFWEEDCPGKIEYEFEEEEDV